MATLTLIIGVSIFLVGIFGQALIGRRFRKQTSVGDRRGARLILTLAAVIIGAWLVIASAAALLHSRSHTQQHTSNPS